MKTGNYLKLYILSGLIALFLASSFLLKTAYGAGREAPDDNYSKNKQKVYDNANILSEAEEEELEELIDTAAHKGKLDIVVLTTYSINGRDPIIYAADFYDDNGFGYDYKTGTGVILLINMGERDVALAGAGLCKLYLPDKMLDDIREEITPYLSGGNYFNAAREYVGLVLEEALEAADSKDYREAIEEWYSKDYSDSREQDAFYDKYEPRDNFFTVFRNPLIDIAIGLAVAAIAVGIMFASSKTANSVNSRTYMEGGLNLRVCRDQFTHTTTAKRRVETQSSGGSSRRCGSHRSSSGHSHSGSRGKF